MNYYWKDGFNVEAHFVQRLKELKAEKRCTVVELCKVVKISKYTYKKFENGQSLPKAKTLIHFAQFYGVTCEYMLGLSDLRVMPAKAAAEETKIGTL